jgi:DNA polymerase
VSSPDPDEPQKPEIPIDPDKPAIPEIPVIPEPSPVPETPAIPQDPETPVVPEIPVLPPEPGVPASLFGDAGPHLPEAGETIEGIRADIGECTRCELFTGRTQVVHSTGNFQADLMFVGEAPGADEDAQGFPFVGRAGQLLTRIIEGIGFRREDVFIGNINRCRPPGNRAPTLPEAHTCRPFLLREIAVVRPKVIVVLGNTALHNLLDTKVGITKMRGQFQDYFGVKVMPTFHPAYLLRDPHKKREVWEDMKKVRDYIKKNA